MNGDRKKKCRRKRKTNKKHRRKRKRKTKRHRKRNRKTKRRRKRKKNDARYTYETVVVFILLGRRAFLPFHPRCCVPEQKCWVHQVTLPCSWVWIKKNISSILSLHFQKFKHLQVKDLSSVIPTTPNSVGINYTNWN